MKNNVRVIGFAVVLGIVCSALLAGISELTEPYRLANERADEVRNILEALEAELPEDASAGDLLEIFENDVNVIERAGITLYEYVPGGSADPEAVAVPVAGPGLWGPIEGVVALEPDLGTIRGVRFYKQEETPGLGGEIGSDWFQTQFSGKRLVTQGGEPEFRVVKPDQPAGNNAVDGITGATMTSDRIEAIMDELAATLQEVR